MEHTPTASIISHFSSITNSRVEWAKQHKLSDIFFITLCAVIAGADNWVTVEQYALEKKIG